MKFSYSYFGLLFPFAFQMDGDKQKMLIELFRAALSNWWLSIPDVRPVSYKIPALKMFGDEFKVWNK